MNSPLISIIVPVYNVEKYLKGCLSSIQNQDYKNWECILVNDGSKDSSGDICEEFAAIDCRFKVYHQKNAGVSVARNKGLNNADGEWICFVDSDDYLESYALTYMLTECINLNADVILCALSKNEFSGRNQKALCLKDKEKLIWSCLTYRTAEYAANGFMIDAPHAKLFRASIIRDQNLRYVAGLCKSEDALFDAQFYQYANIIILDTTPVYRYSINPTSICRTYKIDNIPMFELLMRHEDVFINEWYSNHPLFKNALKLRAYIALEQVLYEADAVTLPLKERVKALKMFQKNIYIKSLIESSKYSDIKAYLDGRSKYMDLRLAQKEMFYSLCIWVDLCRYVFKMRVQLNRGLKRVLGIDQSESLFSIFTK